MVDRTPQQFGGVPDGVTDSTGAIQAAIDAWQPGDQVVVSGGTFRTTGYLRITQNDLVLRGDGKITAKMPFVDSLLFEVTGQGVVFDTDGLELDQANVIASGDFDPRARRRGAAGAERGLPQHPKRLSPARRQHDRRAGRRLRPSGNGLRHPRA